MMRPAMLIEAVNYILPVHKVLSDHSNEPTNT